jgi:hypothetical protein
MRSAEALDLYANAIQSRSIREYGGDAFGDHCAQVRAVADKLRAEELQSRSQRFDQADVNLLHEIADGLTTDLQSPNSAMLRPQLRANAEQWNRIAGMLKRAAVQISLEHLPE